VAAFATLRFFENTLLRFKLSTVVLFIALLNLLAAPAASQTGEVHQVSSVFAVLTDALDAKTAAADQPVSLRIVSDVVVNGRVVIPANSRITGHVTQVTNKGKDQPSSALAIVIDKAVRTDGILVPLQAIIAAVAAPKDNSLPLDPTYALLHSNEPRMTGSAGGASSGGDISASSKASSTAPVATAELKGRMDEGWQLTEDSSGAIGYSGVSVSWSLATAPPFTIFVSKNKNLKLSAGTQVLLRMVPPSLAR
jgi:hypothetical protein